MPPKTFPTSMTNRYHQLPLGSASPGMTLSDPVLDTKGNILLPKGTQLTAAMLASLQRHQIDTVAIADSHVSAEEDSAERDRRMIRVAHLFRQPGSLETTPQPRSSASDVLRQFVLNYRLSDLS